MRSGVSNLPKVIVRLLCNREVLISVENCVSSLLLSTGRLKHAGQSDLPQLFTHLHFRNLTSFVYQKHQTPVLCGAAAVWRSRTQNSSKQGPAGSWAVSNAPPPALSLTSTHTTMAAVCKVQTQFDQHCERKSRGGGITEQRLKIFSYWKLKWLFWMKLYCGGSTRKAT